MCVWSWEEMWFLKYRWGRSIDDGDVHGRRKQEGGESGGGEGGAAMDAFQVTPQYTLP